MRKMAYNRRLAQWRVMWLIEPSVSHQLLWGNYSLVLQNPPHRQAANRYQQPLKTDTTDNKRRTKMPTLRKII